MTDKAKRVQRAVRWYAVSALILTGFVIALVVMLPLQARLFDMQKQHLVYSRDVGVLVVDSCFIRLKEIAKQISMRVSGRELMVKFNEKKLSQAQLIAELEPVFKNSLSIHSDLVSITRFDHRGHLLFSVGKPIASTKIMQQSLKNHLLIYGPFLAHQENYLLVISPVKNIQDVVIADDVFTFELNKLQNMIREKMHSRLGSTSIFYIQDKKLHWLFMDNAHSRISQLLSQNISLNQTLMQSIEKNQPGMISAIFQHEGTVLAFAPVPHMPWGVVVAADKMDLYHAVQHMILILIVLVLFILLMFAFGLSAVLRPLSGRLLLYNEELQDLVAQGQLELKSLNNQLYLIAMVDSLTNTLTRRAFYQRFLEELSRCKRHQRTCVLLFMDIDKFKLINDNLGHDAGDFLLKEFSKRLFALIREEDILARLGGDEFALLLPEKLDEISILEVVNKIKTSIKMPMHYKESQFSVTVSIGAAVYPIDGESVDELLKVADERMYKDKHERSEIN